MTPFPACAVPPTHASKVSAPAPGSPASLTCARKVVPSAAAPASQVSFPWLPNAVTFAVNEPTVTEPRIVVPSLFTASVNGVPSVSAPSPVSLPIELTTVRRPAADEPV